VQRAAVKNLTDQRHIESLLKDDKYKSLREEVVLRLANQELLADIALNDTDSHVNIAAVTNLEDQRLLATLARNNSCDYCTRLAVLKKVTDQDLLADIIKTGNWMMKTAAITNFNDYWQLSALARQSDEHSVSQAAALRIKEVLRHSTDQNLLVKIVREEPRFDVREAALTNITDQTFIADVATHDKDEWVRRAATEKLQNQHLLVEIALGSDKIDVRKAAIGAVTDQAELARIANGTMDGRLAEVAVRKLTDSGSLAEIALTHRDCDIRDIAFKKLPADQEVIKNIARGAQDSVLRANAVLKLTSPTSLAEIAKTDADTGVRVLARGRLTDRSLIAELSGLGIPAPFERYETKSAAEAVQVLFDKALPLVPSVTPDRVQHFCIHELGANIHYLSGRLFRGPVDKMRKLVIDNVTATPRRLPGGQQVLGYQVMIVAYFAAAVNLSIGDKAGNPGYMFGARCLRSESELVIYGWDGFRE
jgi:hypothetical protein